MDQQPQPSTPALQATLFDFAIAELVRQHRESFLPLWTAESWAKLLIWLSLHCGCSGDGAGLEAFAGALGQGLGGRMRRLFFQRELVDLGVQVLADPAESQVLLLPLEDPSGPMDDLRLGQVIDRVGLAGLVVVDPRRWSRLEAAVAVPWAAGSGRG